MNGNDLAIYKQRVLDHIEALMPTFAQASIGDFSQNLKIPEQEDEFTSLYVGIQIMLEVVREKIQSTEQINRQLQERIEEKTALLQSIGDGVVVLDREGKVTFLNKSGSQLVGWSESETLGKHWIDIVPLELVDGTAVPSDKRPFDLSPHPVGEQIMDTTTYYYVRKDRIRFPVSTTIAPIVIDGEKTGSVLVFRDVTKEKELQQLKDDFLSLTTHQLRSPLSTMRWTLESLLAEGDKLSIGFREKLENVYRNNQTMIELVDDILSVSRMGQGTLEEQKKPALLPSLLENALGQLKIEAARKHVVFSVEIKNESLKRKQYLVDATLLSHCIQNIVSNAVKYSNDGGAVYLVLDERDNQVCLDVKDQGVGISETDQPHIFEKFYRGQNVVQMNIPGSGLGLFVVRSLIKRWGGQIVFKSKENEGTIVTICIPLEPADKETKGAI